MGAAGLVVLVSAPVGAGVAHAAPAPPTAYAALARAYPLFWSGAGLPVGDLRVPYVSGLTNNLTNNTPVADADAVLTKSDLTKTHMSGEDIKGLTCSGFDEAACKDPFLPEAKSIGSARFERAASFEGREGKFPGRIHSLVDCLGDCAKDVIRSSSDASGAKGGVETFFTIGGSSASQDLILDDRGRLFSVARSSLSDVTIGPGGEVRFSRLTTIASTAGAGSESSEEGRADVRIENFVILDNPVELTRAGIRLANGAPSEKEAYDGGKVLLQQLKERGITLGLPDFNAQVTRKPDHVTVDTGGLTVRFDQSVQGPAVSASTQTQPLELGHSTAVVAAFDSQRQVDVTPSGEVVVDARQPVAAPPLVPGPDGASAGPTTTRALGSSKGRPDAAHPGQSAGATSSSPGSNPVRRPDGTAAPGGDATLPPGQVTGPAQLAPPSPATGPDEGALSATQVARSLGLRDARRVSRAFGAFLGLGLILPLARLVIRRLG
jgi:hypothetical protein